ncbi:hypothetical protein AVEN_92069-1 [Araneus ventricosus]|uniref:MADF domain-containing protein n=1 Tax=Araneus ventricosus TaxID=182803 RepID=A0A4Y2UEB4_ARAVE|nr:hypothetical protein AVEN_92069-1 [Araneus ventricosus]
MEYCLDSELMILEVEKYPYLYDSRHNDFKNRELKKDAWMAVTKNVIEEKWDQMDEKTRSNVGLMKQFIKSLPKDGECFRYLCSKFPNLSEAKLKEGVFTGPDKRKLLSDSLFSETMGDREKEAWDS